jgi:hypothetical protein
MAKEKAYTRRVDNSANIQKQPNVAEESPQYDLLFGKKNYKFILIGIGLIFLGMAFMAGGHMPSPDVWDESLIYNWRRITLAPILILCGLALNVYAIFVKK